MCRQFRIYDLRSMISLAVVPLLLAVGLSAQNTDYSWRWQDINYSSIPVQEEENERKILKKVSTLQIPFIENQGQIGDESVRYYAQTFGGAVFITKDGEIVYSLPKYEEENVVKLCVIKENLIGASITCVEGEEKTATRVSYFKGNNSEKWRNNIPTYNLLSLGEVYEGIELKLRAYGKNVEKLFYIHHGADPEDIRVDIEGTEVLRINDREELEVKTPLGTVKFSRPLAYQYNDDEFVYVDVSYIVEDNRYGFEVGDYDPEKELVIDPLLASTYLGGEGYDRGRSIVLDGEGNVYVAGFTGSTDFPVTPGSYDMDYNGGEDIFVSKLDGNLTTLLASTYLGGSHNEALYNFDLDMALDGAGNVYIAGYTYSTNFPVTPDAYDLTYNGGLYDGFVAKLNGNLDNLIASTFLGGSMTDNARAISIGVDGNVYIFGGTSSSNFPVTSGAYDTTYNGGFINWDVYISKLGPELDTLISSTFFGGAESEEVAFSIWVDSDEYLYITGYTLSSDFPITPNAYDTDYDIFDCYVSKMGCNLDTLLASTFIGGTNIDEAHSFYEGGDGCVYVTGITYSSDFPVTPAAYDTEFNGDRDAFVSKLDGNLQNLVSSTFLGGTNWDWSNFISLDGSGNVYVTGLTNSSDFPITPNAYDMTQFGSDVFISKFGSNLDTLFASTFLGGECPEEAYCIRIDNVGNVYVTGETEAFFPTTQGAYDSTWNGLKDAFVSKLDANLSAEVGIEESSPESFFLFLDGPNPFSNQTTIRYMCSCQTHISLNIHDLTGRLVKTLSNEDVETVHYSTIWDGRDNAGKEVPNGLYFLRFEAGEFRETRKMILLK